MLHAEQLDSLLLEQCELRQRAGKSVGMDSYFANMNVCPDCLKGIAVLWLEQNLDALIPVEKQADPELITLIDLIVAVVSAFHVGFALGHVAATVAPEES